MSDFTVFLSNGFQDNGADQGEFAGLGLQDLVDACVKRWPNCIPVAWAPNHDVYVRGLATVQEEAEKAGQFFDYLVSADRWVPTLEEVKPSATPTLEQWATFVSPEVQAERRANAAMIARDGPQLVKRTSRPAPVAPVSTALPPLSALTLTPDLSDTSHQVRPAFGSAWLVG